MDMGRNGGQASKKERGNDYVRFKWGRARVVHDALDHPELAWVTEFHFLTGGSQELFSILSCLMSHSCSGRAPQLGGQTTQFCGTG